MPLAPNQRLFEYRIVRILGQRAFGTIYLAHDVPPDQAAMGLRGRAGRLLVRRPWCIIANACSVVACGWMKSAR